MEKNISAISDSQCEAGVIATLLVHPEFILHIDFLKAGYFYDTVNGSLFWAIDNLYKQGIDNIDAVNISNMLNSNNAVKKKMEEYNLTNISEFIELSKYAARETLAELIPLAKQVTTLAFKRELNRFGDQIQKNCFKDDMDLSKLNQFVNTNYNKLTEKFIMSDELVSYGEIADDLFQEIVDRRTESGLFGIPFKFPTLNEYLTLEKTEMIVIGARAKRGKSAIMLNQAVHSLQCGVPTVYIDTEMSDRLFHERILANLSGVEVKRIKNGRYDAEEEIRILEANDWLKRQPFYHIYLPEHTNEQLYAIHKILKNKIGLEFSIFDYIKSNVISTSENYNILGEKTDFLKNKICGELNLTMLTAVQLNRNNEVADSDKISRHASALLTWDFKNSEMLANDGIECGNCMMKVVLNRLGEQMTEDEYIDFNFDGNLMRVSEAKQHVENLPFDS